MSDDVRIVEPLDRPPDATIGLPGSKSLTNRALVCAALATGVSTIRGALDADDTRAMVGALSALGAAGDWSGRTGTIEVTGPVARSAPDEIAVHAGLSGTTSRFLLPVAAMRGTAVTIDGGPPLRARPMAPALDALRALGAAVEPLDAPGRLPVRVTGPLVGGEVEVSASGSSQFASGLLLAGPTMADGLALRITGDPVSRSYVDMTVSVMRAFGAEVEHDGSEFRVAASGYRPATFDVEPDLSAASYFAAAAVITGGRVMILDVDRDSVQGDVAFIELLADMGARVSWTADGVVVSAGDRLSGVDADLRDFSDTAQTLAVTAVFADTPTRVSGIGFIRRKETDRVGDVVAELRRCGIDAEEEPDGFVVRPGTPHPATVRTHDDHRMAMSFALLGLRVRGIGIADPGCVAKTFPDFWAVLDGLRTVGRRTRR